MHPSLKCTLWALAGIIIQISTTPPSGKTTVKSESVDRGSDSALMWTFRKFYGTPIYWGLSWALTICEILTILSPSFRHLTSFPNTYDVSSIDGTFLAIFTSLVVFFSLRMYCYKTLGNFFTFGAVIRPNHKLITSGPYGIVRHPSYTSWFGIAISNLLLHLPMTESWPLRCLFTLWTLDTMVVSCLLWARTHNEDDMLRNNFGVEWISYKKRVQYRLFPGIL